MGVSSFVVSNFWHSFLSSTFLITTSELGDKSFFITSIMSIQKSRLPVFLGAISASFVMNIVSVFLGHMTTNISPWIINYISIGVFFVFGWKMLCDGLAMDDDFGCDYEEANEVDQNGLNTKHQKDLPKQTNFVTFLQIFSLIFFAEWGDKSQLSTILLVAREGIWSVGLGAFVDYIICHSIAVLASREIAKILSIKKITIIGGFIFIICSLLKIYY